MESKQRGQFFRVEKYARKAGHGKPGGNNIDKIAYEAERKDGYCPHVSDPQPPVRLYGCSPSEAANHSRIWAAQKLTPYLDKRSGLPKLRKFREDSACALVGVVSAPPEWKRSTEWAALRRRTVNWLRKKYGDRLLSVVEHIDEPQPHIHFWVVPRSHEDFDAVHPGAAASAAVPKPASKRAKDSAYKSAMSALQDEFYVNVGSPSGLKRISVGGKRRDRQGHLEQQTRTRSLNQAFEAGKAAAHAQAAQQLQASELRAETAIKDAEEAKGELARLLASLRSGARVSGPLQPASAGAPSQSRAEVGASPARPIPVVHAATRPAENVKPLQSAPERRAHPTPFDGLRKPSPFR